MINNFATTIQSLPLVRGQYRQNYNLSQNSWFGCGGNCAVFFKPVDADDLQYFLQNVDKNIKVVTIGALSNTIIRDGGFDGVVIKLGREFASINLENNILRCGSAVLDYNLANFAAENELKNFEFLIGIPGSIGGNVIMNAGCYGGEICDIFSSASGFDLSGNFKIITKKQANFGYRISAIKDFIITGVDFVFERGNRNEILTKMNDINTKKEASQPLKQKTCGSTFANPTQNDIVGNVNYNTIPKAWELVKGVLANDNTQQDFTVGGAFFSPKHYNFMINNGTATATDIESLGEEVKKRVLEKYVINLRWEIKFIGNSNNS